MSILEKEAAEAWKEYHKAIRKHKLDKIQDAWHQEGEHIGFMYDSFFAGYYECEKKLHYVIWFFQNADFGPGDDDFRNMMKERYEKKTGYKVPEGF